MSIRSAISPRTILAALLLTSVPAFAQRTPTPPTPRQTAPQAQTYAPPTQRITIEEGDTVEGGVQRPTGEVVDVVKRKPRETLIRMRTDFNAEMIKSIENL